MPGMPSILAGGAGMPPLGPGPLGMPSMMPMPPIIMPPPGPPPPGHPGPPGQQGQAGGPGPGQMGAAPSPPPDAKRQRLAESEAGLDPGLDLESLLSRKSTRDKFKSERYGGGRAKRCVGGRG